MVNEWYTNELNTLNANIITIINKLKNQNKRVDIDSIVCNVRPY